MYSFSHECNRVVIPDHVYEFTSYCKNVVLCSTEATYGAVLTDIASERRNNNESNNDGGASSCKCLEASKMVINSE